MSAVADLGAASRMLRDALRDKRYRATPLGLEVARYIRWKRNEWGATPETIRDYESILARLALFFADLDIKDFEVPLGAERLRECWDHHWGTAASRTRAKVRSVWVDFFDWIVREQRGLYGNPARILTAPKRRGVKREPFGAGLVDKVIAAQTYLPDKLGAILILKYGLRRAELAQVAFKDFDFERQQLTLTGKGLKVRVIPIVESAFWRDLAAAQLEHRLGPESFLLYRTNKRGMETFVYHNRALVPRSVHTWWYRCLSNAGLVTGDRDDGTWKGLGMHRGRHTVATDILRRTGNIVAAQHLLGHENLETTEESYAMFDTADLASVLREMRPDEVDE